MKKFVLFTIVVCVLLFNAFTVAASDYDAYLSVDYETEGENIVLTASIVDISDPSGLILIDYEIYYDSTALKLTDTYVSMPSNWGDDGEDWSKNNGNGVYTWSVLNASSGVGVTEDGVLYVELTFKPLKNTKTDIGFECKYAVNDNTEELSANNVSVSIDLSDLSDVDIDEDADIEDIINNNNNTGSNDNPSDETGEPDNGNQTDSENGNTDTNEESSTEDNDGDTSANDEVIDDGNDSQSIGSDGFSSVESSNVIGSDTDESNGSFVVWITIGIVGGVAAVVAVIVLKNRKAK